MSACTPNTLLSALTDACALIDGWNQGTQWTTWDADVRRRLGEELKALSAESETQRWIAVEEKLPDEFSPVFFMTATAHWAGCRIGEEWHDTGDDVVCRTKGVVRWMPAPFSKAYPEEDAA